MIRSKSWEQSNIGTQEKRAVSSTFEDWVIFTEMPFELNISITATSLSTFDFSIFEPCYLSFLCSHIYTYGMHSL